MIKSSGRCRAGILISVLTLILTSCSTVHAEAATAQCHTDDDCRVVVSVTCAEGALACDAIVDVDGLYLNGHNAFWDLTKDAATQGFRFNRFFGISFKYFAGQMDFDCKPNGSSQYKCKNDSHAPNGTRYDYSVQILGPKPVRVLDPWVVNR